MNAEKIELHSVREAAEAIDRIGSDNSRLMATRAIHVNVLIRQVPGAAARVLKTLYNDIGAEAAISSQAYKAEKGAVTDMIVMGTIYQHREVRRVLAADEQTRPWIEAIESVVENALQTREA
jgi:hypothetical protein